MKGSLIATMLVGVLALPACSASGDKAQAAAPAPAKALTGLDSSFGNGGKRVSPLSAGDKDRFMAITAASDGKLYATGFVAKGGDQQMALTRFTRSGELDRTFGTDGVATVNVAVGGKAVELARAVVVQPSGKIVIAGPVEHDVTAKGALAKDGDIAVVRFDTSGRLDPTFGKDGISRIDLGPGKAIDADTVVGDSSWGLGSRPDDKLVVFGATHAGGGRADADFALVGLTSAGSLDAGFGTSGVTKVDLDKSGDSPRNVVIQRDGKILATGYARGSDDVVSPVVIRASATGQLDTTFGNGGIATAKVLPGVAESYSLAIQGDDYVLTGYGRGASEDEKVDMLAYRFDASGKWDSTFGTKGLTRVDNAKEDDRGRNVLVLPDGRILVVGSGKLDADRLDAMAVLLSKDGTPVAEFGTAGKAITDLGGPADSWYGVTLSADKKYVYVVGYKGADPDGKGNDDAAIARFAL